MPYLYFDCRWCRALSKLIYLSVSVMGAKPNLITKYILVVVLVIIDMEKVSQVVNTPVEKSPKPRALDYVNAVILNEAKQALVFELPRRAGAGVEWQVLSHELPVDSDPFTAVQTALLHKIGYQTSHWSYLGSHVMAKEHPAGAGYFFCAQQAHLVAAPQPNGTSPAIIRWVSLTDLRYALLDGRIPSVTHALTVSLTFLALR
jgi:hypothetical protein